MYICMYIYTYNLYISYRMYSLDVGAVVVLVRHDHDVAIPC